MKFRVNFSRLACIFIILISLCNCATTRESTVLGLSLGGIMGCGLGAAIGGAQAKPKTGALMGSLIGAAVGGLIGYHSKNKSSDDSTLTNFRDPNFKTDEQVFMTMPTVRRLWIPDHIEGQKLIKGHFIYQIEKPGTWKSPASSSDDKGPKLEASHEQK